MRDLVLALALLFGSTSFLRPVQAQSALSGVIASPDGQPVANAEISRFWVLGTPDGNGARAYGSARSDSAGRFSLPLEQNDLPVTLVVYASDRSAAAVVEANDLGRPVRVVVAPTLRVRADAKAPLIGTKLHEVRFLWQTTKGITLAQLFGNNVEFPFVPGNYMLSLSSADTVSVTKPITLRGPGSLTLHESLTLSPMAQHYGRQPPQLGGLVDDHDQPFAVSRFDRPTLLYFWADWCQPCIAEGIPHLLEFAKAHHGERFHIVAIHENGVPTPSSFATFQRSLKHLQADVWKQPFVFPFVFDKGAKVTSEWGLSTFPTYALVDAQGRLQPEAGLDQLEALIKKQSAGREPK